MSVGDKIKTLRKAMGLTQTELGERVGVKKNAVSKWECGRVEDIPTSTIRALANLFDVPPSYLIDDEAPASEAPDILDEIDVAFYGDYKVLNEEHKETLRAMARLFRERQDKQE